MIRIRLFPLRLAALLVALGFLGACADAPDPTGAPMGALGDFYLGHNIITVNEPAVSPVSRRASDDEWQAVMEDAIERRFRGYDGTRYYHIGISVDGYALAPPGVPLVVAPKSVLLISATIWDDAKQAKINETPERFTIFEGLNAETMIGSGITKSKEEQMQTLATNAAEAVHRWLLSNRDWFEGNEPAGPPAQEGDAPAETVETPDETVAVAPLPAPEAVVAN